jgi:hypothetical protein
MPLKEKLAGPMRVPIHRILVSIAIPLHAFPIGSPPNGIGHTVLSPTLAAAKGIGHWDIQTTIGANLPVSGANFLGRAIVFNTAVGCKIKGRIWPMLEQNSVFWSGGTLDGKKQVFLTPGFVLGSFPVAERLRFAIGGGMHIAVTEFHQYNHRCAFLSETERTKVKQNL